MTAKRIQLGTYEFDRALLEVAPIPRPTAWDGVPVMPLDESDWLKLPPDGWCLLADVDRISSGGYRHVVLAAPAPASAWWLVYLSWQGDSWQGASGLQPLPLRPDKASRRQGLRLDWPTGALTARLGQTLHTVVQLHNDGEQEWSAAEDPLAVLTFILDVETGQPLPSERWKAYAPLQGVETLLPAGGTIELPVEIALRHGAVSPGRHAVRASVASLDLRSPTIPLTVTCGDSAQYPCAMSAKQE